MISGDDTSSNLSEVDLNEDQELRATGIIPNSLEAGSTVMATAGPDQNFLSSLTGLLRVAEIILGICGLICIESIGEECYDNYKSRYEFALFVVITSFIIAFLVVMIFVLRAQDAMNRCLNVPLFLLVADSFIALFYLIVCLLEFTAYCTDPDDNASSKVAGVFGLFGMMCFFVSSYLSYKFFQEERLPSPPPPGLHAVTVTQTLPK